MDDPPPPSGVINGTGEDASPSLIKPMPRTTANPQNTDDSSEKEDNLKNETFEILAKEAENHQSSSEHVQKVDPSEAGKKVSGSKVELDVKEEQKDTAGPVTTECDEIKVPEAVQPQHESVNPLCPTGFTNLNFQPDPEQASTPISANQPPKNSKENEHQQPEFPQENSMELSEFPQSSSQIPAQHNRGRVSLLQKPNDQPSNQYPYNSPPPPYPEASPNYSHAEKLSENPTPQVLHAYNAGEAPPTNQQPYSTSFSSNNEHRVLYTTVVTPSNTNRNPGQVIVLMANGATCPYCRTGIIKKETDICCFVLLMILVICTFPIGLLFLLCLSWTQRYYCTSCGRHM